MFYKWFIRSSSCIYSLSDFSRNMDNIFLICPFLFSACEQNIVEMNLCTGCCSGPQGEQLFSQFPLPPVLRTPDVASLSTQLYFSQISRSHLVPSSQPDSGLLGAGFYKLQLGSFPEDPAPPCSERVASPKVQFDFSLPSSPSVPDFGVIGSLLCTSSSICSTQQWRKNIPHLRKSDDCRSHGKEKCSLFRRF